MRKKELLWSVSMLEREVENLDDDNELVRQTFANANNFRFIIKKYEAPLRRYLARTFGFAFDDREDVLQEVFIAVYRNLNDFDPSLKFSSWIYRVAHNKAIDFWRGRQAKHRADWDDEAMANIPDPLDLTAELDNNYLRGNLNALLGRLDERYRSVIVLRYLEEKDYGEISDILQKPPGTVAAWLSRAKKELAKLAETHKEKFK